MVVTKNQNFEDKCTGCFACQNICSTNAIKLQLNEEGFFYPYLNKEICIECGRCNKVCPISREITASLPLNNKETLFTIQADNMIREKSSSGGAFYLLANEILLRGGIVYGAAFDPEKKMVRHTNTDVTSLEKIMRFGR